MKKILFIAIISLLTISFSGVAWSSVEGDWNIMGKMSTKIKIKGEGSEKAKGEVADYFSFYPDGYFEMIDASGEWAAAKKGFIIDLDIENLEAFYEDMLFDATGIDFTVVVEDATFTGKYKESKMKGEIVKKPESIKGKFKFSMSLSSELFEGSIKAQCKFQGTRDGVAPPTASINGDVSLESALLEAILNTITE